MQSCENTSCIKYEKRKTRVAFHSHKHIQKATHRVFYTRKHINHIHTTHITTWTNSLDKDGDLTNTHSSQKEKIHSVDELVPLEPTLTHRSEKNCIGN